MSVDQTILERLSFIKYLYELGIEQSQKPEPMCYPALLTFHDAIELFLDLIAEKFGIKTTDLHFMEYFAEINNK